MKYLTALLYLSSILLLPAQTCLAKDLPEVPVLLWKHRLGTGSGGAVSGDSAIIVAATPDGTVTALSPTGKVKWTRKIDNASFEVPALLTKQHIIIGASEGTLYALKRKTGKTSWKYSTDDVIQGKAVSPEPDRAAVIGQSSGSIHYIDTNNGSLIWKVEETNRCDGPPARSNGNIIFGNCDAAIYVYSGKTGKRLHAIDLGPNGQVAGGVGTAGSLVVSGTHGGSVACADLSTGKLLWTFDNTDSSVYTTPAVAANRVVFTSDMGTVYCLDSKTGKLLWKKPADGDSTSPLIHGNSIIVSTDGTLRILSLKTGEATWFYEAGDETTEPAVIDGKILIVSDDGTVSAFGAK